MSKKTEVLKLALDALEPFTTPNWAGTGVDKANEAYAALRDALAEESSGTEQPAQQIVEEYDPDKRTISVYPSEWKAQQEPFALLVRKHSWNKGQYECAPPNAPEYGRQWADERVWVYTSPPAPRKPLTDEAIRKAFQDCDEGQETQEFIIAFARAIEQAHGITGEQT